MCKFTRSLFEDYLPDYQGGTNYDAACDYILCRFVSLIQGTVTIYVHYTCATDTQQIKCMCSFICSCVMSPLTFVGICIVISSFRCIWENVGCYIFGGWHITGVTQKIRLGDHLHQTDPGRNSPPPSSFRPNPCHGARHYWKQISNLRINFINYQRCNIVRPLRDRVSPGPSLPIDEKTPIISKNIDYPVIRQASTYINEGSWSASQNGGAQMESDITLSSSSDIARMNT